MENAHSDFPVHIELGKTIKEETHPGAMMELGAEGGEKEKKYYPTLYINDIEGIDKVPEDGYVMVKLKRKRLIEEASEGEGKEYDAEFEVHEICLPEESEETGHDEESEDSIDELAEKVGIDTGKKKGKKKEEPKEEMAESEDEEY